MARLPSRTVLKCLLVALVWRLMFACWAVATHYLMKPCACRQSSMLRDAGWPANPFTLALDAMYRGDAPFYVSIARDGYSYSTHVMSTMGFYPLFPLAIKAASVVVGNVYIAAVIASTLAFFSAMALLGVWLERHGLGERAPLAVALMLCYPFSLFEGAIYAEPLFLALVLAALLAAERDRWLECSLWTGLFVLTRPTGLFVLPAIAVLAWTRRPRNPRSVAPFISAGAALGGFMLYQWARFGTPFAYAHAKTVKGWENTPERLVQDLLLRGEPGRSSALLLIMLGIGVVFLASVPLVFRRFGTPYAVFSAFCVIGSLFALANMSRYAGVAFPTFAAVAKGGRPKPILALGLFMAYGLGLVISLWELGFTID